MIDEDAVLHPGFGGTDEGSHMSQWRARPNNSIALDPPLAVVPVEEAIEAATKVGKVMLVITAADEGERAKAVLEALGYKVERVEVEIADDHPWLTESLPDGYVWCHECRSDLYVGEVTWPDPAEHEPGEQVEQWISCYVEVEDDESYNGEGVCDTNILITRTVNPAGDGYDGPPTNAWLPGREAKP